MLGFVTLVAVSARRPGRYRSLFHLYVCWRLCCVAYFCTCQISVSLGRYSLSRFDFFVLGSFHIRDSGTALPFARGPWGHRYSISSVAGPSYLSDHTTVPYLCALLLTVVGFVVPLRFSLSAISFDVSVVLRSLILRLTCAGFFVAAFVGIVVFFIVFIAVVFFWAGQRACCYECSPSSYCSTRLSVRSF